MHGKAVPTGIPDILRSRDTLGAPIILWNQLNRVDHGGMLPMTESWEKALRHVL